MKTIFLLCALVAITLPLQAQDLQLPAPTRTGGKALMETLNERRSERSFVKKDMPLQTLSDLLWAANGFNRPDKRTAPTASNRQEQEIYVIIKDKAYHHDARQNILKFIASGDFSAALGQGNITANAAVNIVIVADNTSRPRSTHTSTRDTSPRTSTSTPPPPVSAPSHADHTTDKPSPQPSNCRKNKK